MNSKLRTLVWITEKKSPQPERTAGDFFTMELFAVLGYLQTIVSNGLFTSQILPTKKPRKVQQNRWPLSGPISGHEITQERPLFYLYDRGHFFAPQIAFHGLFRNHGKASFFFADMAGIFWDFFWFPKRPAFIAIKLYGYFVGYFGPAL